MAKTLKTGDVKKFPINIFRALGNYSKWIVVGDHHIFPVGIPTRKAARKIRYADERIAKIIKRTPKYVFVEVSK